MISKLSIVTKVLLIVTLFNALALLTSGLKSVQITKTNFQKSEQEKLKILADAINPILAANISFGLTSTIPDFIENQQKSNPGLLMCKLTDKLGVVIFQKTFSKEQADAQSAIYLKDEIFDPITKEKIGFLELAYSNQNYRNYLKEHSYFLLNLGFYFLIFTLLLLFFLLKTLQPVRALATRFTSFDPTDKNFLIEKRDGKDELSIIQNAAAKMVENIHAYTKLLENMNFTLEQKVDERTLLLRQSNEQLSYEIVERKKIEEALKQKAVELELANESKSIFLSSMSHEIRTPLNSILGYSQILKKENTLDGRQKKMIKSIAIAGEHLLELINDILDLTKIEYGKMELVEQEFDLKSLLEDIEKMFINAAETKKIELKIIGIPQHNLMLYADRGKLFRVLINLVGNAVKFTDKGEVKLICEQIDGERYRFEVVDTGVGIGDDDKERIFQPFVQNKVGAVKGGTGLGLSIVKKSIEIMGGEIYLESKIGVGSRFFFELIMPDAVGAIARENEVKSVEKRYSFDGILKVLIVDDAEQNRQIMSEMLEQLDIQMEIDFAEDGEQAVKSYMSTTPHIVFMDIMMEKMSGIEASRLILSHDSNALIVAVTAALSLIEKENHHLFKATLAKPFMIKELYDKLLLIQGLKAEEIKIADAEDEEWYLQKILTVHGCESMMQAAELGRIGVLEQEIEQLPPSQIKRKLSGWMEVFDTDNIVAELKKTVQRLASN